MVFLLQIVMNGCHLVEHLQLLGIPGAERLEGDSYDWIFLSGESASLATFFQWFTENVSASDVLTDEELNE